MADDAGNVAPAPASRAVTLDRVLGAAFLACCAAYGLALAHPCDDGWRTGSGFAAAGIGAAWGALASSLAIPAAMHVSPASSWAERKQRYAFLALVAVLAAIAAWAWTGAPGLPSGVSRLPSRTSLLAALWAVLAATCVVGLLKAAPPRLATEAGGLGRLGGMGVVVAGLVFLVYAWNEHGLSRVAMAITMWLNVGTLRYRPAVLGAVLGAIFAAVANRFALEGLESLAACVP